MGYAVYEDRDARDYGVLRWAGYGVPALCDQTDCSEEIDRGLSYKCGQLGEDNFGDIALNGDCMGCGLYFCSEHQYGDHLDLVPKPDTEEWDRWILTEESWSTWRDENPKRVEQMKARWGVN
jgi:hypothetical protein